MPNNNKKGQLVAIDFFCSAGGVTCGFKQAGIDVLGGIDIDEKCKETYEKNNQTKFLLANLSNIPKRQIGKFFGIRRNQRNIIFVGCSPCQYYSNINTDKSKSIETRLLLEDFQDFVKYYRPGYVLIENVPGLDKKPGSPLHTFKKFLSAEKYVFAEDVLNAKYYGVPQNRRRYILLATRLKKRIELPQPDKENIRTVYDAIGNYKLFKPIEAGYIDHSEFIHTAAELSELNLKRIKHTKIDGGDRRDWPSDLQPKCYENHEGHYDVYGRMAWKKPAPTLTTRFVSFSNGRYGHPEQNRAITLREGAAIQTFPNNYIFYSNSQGTIAKMIGNAVPPELARRIGETLLKH